MGKTTTAPKNLWAMSRSRVFSTLFLVWSLLPDFRHFETKPVRVIFGLCILQRRGARGLVPDATAPNAKSLAKQGGQALPVTKRHNPTCGTQSANSQRLCW